MADQMAGLALPSYGHAVAQAPHLERLSAGGVVFESAYCNSPLCAPSRASMLTGQLPSRIGTYDNAAEFPASFPTFGHYLRAMGYHTCLCGKMHFVGPDQLHGFEERLTTDIYPADFGWTPDWERPDHRPSWYHNMLSVVQAGTCQTSNQLDFDEEVGFQAVRKIYDLARAGDRRPFCLFVSFTHPHDPFAVPQEYWDRYEHDQVDLPTVPPLPLEQMDPHSRRVHHVCDLGRYRQTEERVRNARHAYYGAISYVDDKVGQILQALEATGFARDTVVLFTSDHGEMLGERGLWYKTARRLGAGTVCAAPRDRARLPGRYPADVGRAGGGGWICARPGRRRRWAEPGAPFAWRRDRPAGHSRRRDPLRRCHRPLLYDPARPLQVYLQRARPGAALRPGG